jgi:hypothetical protein
LTARSFALVTTGARAIRTKSSAAASGSKLPTETIRPSGTTTTGLDWEELSSSCKMVRA